MAATIKKLFLSSASNAVGTGTILGLHAAMSPEEAKIQDSNLYNPQIDDSRAIMKFDFDGSNGYFAIAMFALVLLVMMTGISLCCGCSPSRMARRKQEDWRREMMERNNQLEVEAGLEAEGWTEVNGGAGTKGSGGLPRLVEGALAQPG